MKKEISREDRYVQFPLCLLMGTYKDPLNGFALILDFGIVHYSESCKNFQLADVARQLMYSYYRNRATIQIELLTQIEQYISEGVIYIDPDYEGFNGLNHGLNFNPEESISDLLKIFESDPNLKLLAIYRHQIIQAAEYLNQTVISMDSTINNYKTAANLRLNFEQRFGSDVMPSIKISNVYDAYKSGNFDQLRVYIAISSLIGQRKFATGNKPAIISRMIGCKSIAAFDYYTTENDKKDYLLPTVEKYNKRYQIDKLLFTLTKNKFIMYLSAPKVSVIYFSKYMEPEELSDLIRSTKDSRDLKKRIREAANRL